MMAILVFHNQTRHLLMNLFTFSRRFKHVDIYTHQGDRWVGFRMGSDGVQYAMAGYTRSKQIIDKAQAQPNVEAVISIDVQERCKFKWIPLTIPMCNELARHLTGIKIGFTWSPRHLYNKLIKYDHKRNYEIFYHWRRDVWDSSAETMKTVAINSLSNKSPKTIERLKKNANPSPRNDSIS